VIFLSSNQYESTMGEVYIDRFSDSSPISYEFTVRPMASVTDPRWTLGPAISNTTNHMLDLIETDCRHSGEYSYGSVETNASDDIIKIVLKGQDGQTISDQINPSISCEKTFHSSSPPNNLSKNSTLDIQQSHLSNIPQNGSISLPLALPIPLPYL
jgi:hypothetical protein